MKVTLEQIRAIQDHGDFEAAEMMYREALKQDANDPEVLVHLVYALVDQNEFDEALRYAKHLATISDLREVNKTLGYLYAAVGQHDKAMEILTDVIDRNRQYGEAHYLWCASQKFKDEPRFMDRFLSKKDKPEDEAWFAFCAGKIYDDIGEYDKAWEQYVKGNRRWGERWMPGDFVGENYRRMGQDFGEPIDNDTTQPIFIVGMPRSGTSLCERILASHPGVISRGERQQMKFIARHWDSGNISQMAEAYVTSAKTDSRFTDKNTSNWAMIPEIRHMFPRATIIQTIRDPKDTALSCYFQPMPSQRWCFDPVHIAIYAKWHSRLTEHWSDMIDYRLHYDELVSNPEAVTRQLIEACNLEWDDACLKPHKSKGAVDTSSHYQTRQPVYKTSLSRSEKYPLFTEIVEEYL